VRLKLAKILGNHKRVHFEDSLATTEGFEVVKFLPRVFYFFFLEV
jgi:hypothetical protein